MSTQSKTVSEFSKARRRVVLGVGTLAAAAAMIVGATGFTPAVAETPSRITVDYAYYNPVSLLLKKKGLVFLLPPSAAAEAVARKFQVSAARVCETRFSPDRGKTPTMAGVKIHVAQWNL